ncbi:MAG TPA: GNAT family N-acetyltransferase [Pirellulaceae bacterium]|nr:GNAT family N-acetyltransferase [Pirellulaceae bacterium]
MATRTVSVARRSPSITLTKPRPTVAAPGLRLTPARTGDHGLIHRLLVSVFHGPSAGEFHAQLDEPGYEPADRLVVKDGEQIAAHLRLARQTIRVGEAALPAARFMDLATAPEYRSRGLATTMLAAGERAAAERGVLIGLTRTRVPALFARLGWAICGRHNYSSAAPRAVLAELGATAAGVIDARPAAPVGLPLPPVEPIVVRPLRRIELPAIVRLYEQQSAGRRGWPIRSEAYWDWLLARGACDRIYVAATGTEPAELPKLIDSIVGYAFVRQCRLVEVIAAPGRDEVARHLTARVCADASEQDDWLVRCDAPPEHPLHVLFRQAGGKVTSSQELGGEVFMARLLDPLALLRQLQPTFTARARAADVHRPSILGIELRSGCGKKDQGVIERFRIQLGRRRTTIETGGPSRHTVTLRYTDLAPLLLGDQSAADLAAANRLRASTKKSNHLAAALFPGNSWWRPPLDDLLA